MAKAIEIAGFFIFIGLASLFIMDHSVFPILLGFIILHVIVTLVLEEKGY